MWVKLIVPLCSEFLFIAGSQRIVLKKLFFNQPECAAICPGARTRTRARHAHTATPRNTILGVAAYKSKQTSFQGLTLFNNSGRLQTQFGFGVSVGKKAHTGATATQSCTAR